MAPSPPHLGLRHFWKPGALIFAALFAPAVAIPELGRSPAAGRFAVRGAAHVAASGRSTAWQAPVKSTAEVDTVEAFRILMRKMIGEGIRSARTLREASDDEAWRNKYSEDFAMAVQELEHAWTTVEEMAQSWQHASAPRARSKEQASPRVQERLQEPPAGAVGDVHGAQDLPIPVLGDQAFIAQAIFVFLAIVVLFCAKGFRSIDLFSPQVVSRLEIALVFATISVSLYVFWDISSVTFLAERPILLYLLQMSLCFLGTVLTVPVVAGCQRGAPRWLVFASQALLLYLSISWYIFNPEWIGIILEGRLGRAQAPIMIPLLNFVLFVVSWHKVVIACGWEVSCLTPFYKRHERACYEYVRNRLTRKSGEEKAAPPSFLPTVVLAGVILTWIFGLVMGSRFVLDIRQTIPVLRKQFEIFFELVAPILESYDIVIPKELEGIITLIMERGEWGCQVGAMVGFAYVNFILFKCITGFHHLFKQMVAGEHYKGKGQVHDPQKKKGYHAQWATYFVGNLFGNAVVGFLVIFFFSSIFAILVTTSQVWLAAREGLLIFAVPIAILITRTLIFTFIIPPYVYNHDGVVLRPGLWAFLFPTVTLLNFILGALNGVIRFAVIFPLMLMDLFRVDKTFLHEDLIVLDFSYHAFLSTVLACCQSANPIVVGSARQLFGSVKDATGRHIVDRSRDNGTGIEMQDMSSEASKMRMKVQRRWWLATTLALNPSLIQFRKHQLEQRGEGHDDQRPPPPSTSTPQVDVQLSANE